MNVHSMEADQLKYQLRAERWEAMSKPRFPQFRQAEVRQQPQAPGSTARQWPWRGLAFASDLGTLGALVKKPRLGVVGWMIALPYYAYAILTQPKGKARREEMLYQATANGIFPMVSLALGTKTGGKISRLAQKHSTGRLGRIPVNAYKAGFGIFMLAALTKAVGDPLSQKLLGWFRNQEGGSWT